MVNKQSVSITVDIKNNRIRIHKFGLHLINDPKHIQLLVSTTKRNIVIDPKPKDAPHQQTIKIENNNISPDNSYEIYSASLCKKLLDAIGIADRNYSYRFYGKHLPKENILIFPFDSVKKIEN